MWTTRPGSRIARAAMMATVLAQRRQMGADRRCRPTTSGSHRLDAMRAASLLGGGPERIERQHAAGKLTARERLDLLLDPGSFVELDAFVTSRDAIATTRILGDGVVTGHGTIDGRLVFVFSQDFTVFGGSLSEAYAEKICKVMDLAMKVGAPIIGLERFRRRADPGRRRVARRLRRHLPAQRHGVRRRAADLGDPGPMRRRRGVLAGDDRLHDHGRGHELHVRHRPERREDRDARGRRCRVPRRRDDPHDAQRRRASRGARRGDRVRRRCARCWRTCRRTTWRMPRSWRRDRSDRSRWTPSSTTSSPTIRDSRTTCTTSCAASSTTATLLEIQPAWAANIIVGFARLGGRSVGIVAQQPSVLAGALDIDASVKAARFVRTCDAFNVPLVTFVDVPGFLPGVEPGARRDHPPRREAAVRLLRGDGPEADGHHAQGVRRRVRRHEQQAHPRRHELRVADGRDRGHGRGGRGQHHLPRRDRRAPRIPVAERARLVAEYEAEFAEPVHRRGARLRRRRHPAVRDPRRD